MEEKTELTDKDMIVVCEVLLELIDLTKGWKKYFSPNYWYARSRLKLLKMSDGTSHYANLQACVDAPSLRSHYDNAEACGPGDQAAFDEPGGCRKICTNCAGHGSVDIQSGPYERMCPVCSGSGKRDNIEVLKESE